MFESRLYLDEHILHKAAWLHDISKYDEYGDKRKNHHKKAFSVLSEYGLTYKDPVCNIIKAHTEKFKPNKKYAMEAAVLRICDKLDKFNKGKEDAQDKCQRSLKVIKKYWRRLEKDIPKAFYKTYEELFNELKERNEKVL